MLHRPLYRTFLRDIDKLSIKKDEHYPKASEKFECMLELVDKLVDKGFAYEKIEICLFRYIEAEGLWLPFQYRPHKVQHGRTIDLTIMKKGQSVDFYPVETIYAQRVEKEGCVLRHVGGKSGQVGTWNAPL